MNKNYKREYEMRERQPVYQHETQQEEEGEEEQKEN